MSTSDQTMITWLETLVGFDAWDVTTNYVEKFPIFCDWYLGRRKLSMSKTKGCEISLMSLEITGLLCSPCKNSPWHAGGFVHLHLCCRIVVHDTPVDVHSEGVFWVLSSRLLGWKIRRLATACTSGVKVCVRVTTKSLAGSKPLMKHRKTCKNAHQLWLQSATLGPPMSVKCLNH